MNPLILMASIVASTSILIVVSRAKAALVFMALCVGAVLSTFVSDTALDMAQTFIAGYNPTTQAVIQLTLLIAPVALTVLFLNRSVGKNWLFNLVPAIFTGVAVLLLVVPLLPDGTKYSVTGTDIWIQLVQYQAIIISIAVMISLSQLWAGGRSARSKKSRKR